MTSAQDDTAATPDGGEPELVGESRTRGVMVRDGSELGSEERENIEPLSAVGLSVSGEDDHADIRLRLTTK